MYLSRIEINRRRRETLHALESPQILHAAIEACFPSADGAKIRNLWRIDTLGRSMYLLLQSENKPDFTHIIEQFGWAGQSWETEAYADFLSRLQEGQVWQFRLRANPTYSISVGKNVRGKVVSYTETHRQKKWLADRAAKYGFEIVRKPYAQADEPAAEKAPLYDDCRNFGKDLLFDITLRETEKFWRQGTLVTVETAVFEGVLRVTCAAALMRAIQNGIGRAKAYGCGLLTLAPQNEA
ncbi:MAG: type I-E CRISPR-associated protein Cas6/Cse3/CasE [Clostridiales Family XIII bacterium]|jgi:CRISPR system Cascade subunit CasE|nr:type I-E CRISPR-associated protein Cas6/Cse3/CasE [Clostridiales Family XIII bacterium]